MQHIFTKLGNTLITINNYIFLLLLLLFFYYYYYYSFTVIPNHFQSKLSIPNPREGTIVIDDVTPDMANIGQEGIIQVSSRDVKG